MRSLEGDAARNDRSAPVENDPRSRGATLVRLGFSDGETLVGMAIGWPPRKPFFFVNPVDPDSNNIRILVNRMRGHGNGAGRLARLSATSPDRAPPAAPVYDRTLKLST